MTIKKILQKTSLPHFEAEILLLRAIVKTRLITSPSPPTMEWLIANPDFPINSETIKQFDSFLVRRSKFEPVAYITNHKEFYSRDFYVDKRVLIPRPESEILVEQSLKIVSAYKLQATSYKLIELGTGSGCIIISIIKELQKQKFNLSSFQFTATDISKDALRVARKNARRHNVDQLIHLVQSDLFSSLQATSYKLQAKFDFIIANLPYVPSYWLESSDWAKTLYYEPNVALEGGKDGLDVYRRFFQEAPKYLAPGGTILIECEDDQVKKILKIIKNLNYKFSHQIFQDYNNLQRTIQITAIHGVD